LYYNAVDLEYKELLQKDTLALAKLKILRDKDSSLLSNSQKKEKEQLENQVQETQRLLNQPIVLPNSSVIPIVYIQFGSEVQRNAANKLITKINDIGYKAPGVELVGSARKLTTNEIRYFRESDENFAKILQNMLKDQNIETLLKPIFGYSNKTKEGTIELWLK